MAIVKWGTPPSGDHHERKAHVVGHGEGVSLAHAAFGDRVDGGGQMDSTNPNHGPATKWSTAPYTGPAPTTETSDPRNVWNYRSPKRAKRCMANNDTCKAWATKASDYLYCHPHSRLAEGKPGFPSNEVPVNDDVADLFDEEA